MILPYVGFFPWEIIFLLLADAFFLWFGDYNLKLNARKRKVVKNPQHITVYFVLKIVL